MSNPQRYTSGLATVPAAQPLGNFPFPDPFHTGGNVGLDVTAYSNDFFTLGTTTVDWTITTTGSGATFAITDGVGGLALLSPGGASSVNTVAQTKRSFQFSTGKQFWYLCRVALGSLTGARYFSFGLQDSTASTPNNGLFFSKDTSSSGAVRLVQASSGTLTTLVSTVYTYTNALPYVDVALYYNGTDLLVYAADAVVARITSYTPPAQLMTSFFTSTVISGTETMTVDYLLVAQETVR